MHLLQLLGILAFIGQAQGAGEGYWDETGYHGELDVAVTQVIKGCTMANIGRDVLSNDTLKDAADLTLKNTIAGTAGVPLNAIPDTVNDPWSVSAETGTDSNGIVLTYKIKATDVTDFQHVFDQFYQDSSTDTFTNLIHLFHARTTSSPACLATATGGTYTMVSSINTFSPTYAPTLAPTAFNAEHFGYLLDKYLVASVIVGSIFGLMVLYYGYWGCYHLYDWYDTRQRRLEDELQYEVDTANKKLHNKFVKVDVDKSPHTSKMRENFKKQFGTLPSGAELERYKGGDSDNHVPLTNLSVGAGSAPRGAQMARTLATKLPGGGSPSRAAQSRSYDVESGDIPQSNPYSPSKSSSNEPSASFDYYDDGTNDKSNRLSSGGRKNFGFADSPGRR